MTTDEATTRVVTTSEADLGPGQRLREAREAAHMSVGEVASRLRLESRVIERLERDDYERLHGPTFVRGYLSGYARLLDLPAGPILEAYERHGFGPPALVSELGRKPEVHVSDFPVRMVTYVIAALLVVLVVLWWQSRQLDEPPKQRAAIGVAPATRPAAAPEASTPADTPSQAASAPAPDARPSDAPAADRAAPEQPPPSEPGQLSDAGNDAAADPQTSTAVRADSGTPAPDVTPVRDAVESVAARATAPTPTTPPEAEGVTGERDDAGEAAHERTAQTAAADAVGSESTGAAGITEGDATAPGGGEETIAEPVAVPRPAPLPGSDVLAIQLSRESWIEIYDRGGGRLYYSLAREGSEVVVQGAGPMRVLLGEVQGAAVAYNGEPYDLSRFEGRSVVRFTVGELSGERDPQPPAAAEEPPAAEPQEPTAEAQAQSVADAGVAVDDAAATPAAMPAPVMAPAPQSASPAPGFENQAPIGLRSPDS